MRRRLVRVGAGIGDSLCARSTRPPTFRPQQRAVHIAAAPANPTTTVSPDPSDSQESAPDARFETLGANSSLLSVYLSASQPLHTRRGTLVGFGGNPSDVVSTLAPLEPLRRAPLAIPWLYQRVTSSTPSTMLVAARAPHTAFAVLDLDGRADWRIVQRDALLAWTGHNLQVRPGLEPRFGLAHLGSTTLLGRGLVALVAAGQVYRVSLAAGETYIAHPSAVLAYAVGRSPEPQPFRFRSTTLRIQVPHLGRFLPNVKFFQDMRETQTFKYIASTLFTLRTWLRRTIWGDRLFIRFKGPTTILLQSRGGRLRDVLTDSDVNEIADSPAGSVQAAVTRASSRPTAEVRLGQTNSATPTMRYASVGQDGKVSIDNNSGKS